MLDTIYCCRFGQRGRRVVFVVLSASAPRILQLRCTTAEGRNVSDPTVFWHDGDWRCSRPLPEREQERPRLSERLSPAPPQVRCLSCRRAGAACSFARAASTCNYNGPFGDFFDQPKVADAVWDLFRDVFGIQKTSVRVVIGVASLPLECRSDSMSSSKSQSSKVFLRRLD